MINTLTNIVLSILRIPELVSTYICVAKARRSLPYFDHYKNVDAAKQYLCASNLHLIVNTNAVFASNAVATQMQKDVLACAAYFTANHVPGVDKEDMRRLATQMGSALVRSQNRDNKVVAYVSLMPPAYKLRFLEVMIQYETDIARGNSPEKMVGSWLRVDDPYYDTVVEYGYLAKSARAAADLQHNKYIGDYMSSLSEFSQWKSKQNTVEQRAIPGA